MNNKLKLTPSMIIRRGHYLYFFYYWIYGRIIDFKLAKKNLNKTIFNDSPDAFPVQCITYPYIKELLKKCDFSSDDVFVDVGCAWGRLIGYMKTHTMIKKFYGVELNAEAAAVAQDIFKNDDKVSIIAGDILDNLPIEGTVFYLFNPFNGNVLDSFLYQIEKKIKHPVKILYLHPQHKEVFILHNHKWRLTETYSLKPKWLGEIVLCVYEY